MTKVRLRMMNRVKLGYKGAGKVLVHGLWRCNMGSYINVPDSGSNTRAPGNSLNCSNTSR